MCDIKKVVEFLNKLLDKYGNGVKISEVEQFFEELESGLEKLGAKVLEKYIAPNGWVKFECGGKIYSYDLSFGLIEGGNYLEVLVDELEKRGLNVAVLVPKEGDDNATS